MIMVLRKSIFLPKESVKRPSSKICSKIFITSGCAFSSSSNLTYNNSTGQITAPELADLELAYAPPFGSAKDPVNMLGYISENVLNGVTPTAQWNEVNSLVSQGWTVVDVRSKGEFDRGHIPNSINISIDEMRERINEVPKEKILVTCQVGQRGHAATRLLREMGYNAVNLDGGYMTWSHSPANTKVSEHV